MPESRRTVASRSTSFSRRRAAAAARASETTPLELFTVCSSSPFRVSGPLCQMFCLGMIAQRLGGTLEFDRDQEIITNNEKANAMLVGPPPRSEWTEFYKL